MKLKSAENDIDNVKNKIKEKDKAKLNFKRKLTDIMQKYGVDFDVDLLDDESIDKIKFSNLQYKNIARDVSVVYDNKNDYYGAYIYTINENKTMDDENYIIKRNYLNKTYKLSLIINEVRQVNELYRQELNDIENKYDLSSKNDISLEKDLKRQTYPKNE